MFIKYIGIGFLGFAVVFVSLKILFDTPTDDLSGLIISCFAGLLFAIAAGFEDLNEE